MRERQQLDEAVTAIKKLERDLEDGATLIELGEMEGDESSIREGEAAILAVEKEAASQCRTSGGTMRAGSACPRVPFPLRHFHNFLTRTRIT